MKIDFHMHTSRFSSCAVSSALEQVQAAYDAGLDAIFITEHMVLFPQDDIDRLNETFAPMKIYQGIEVTICDSNLFEDIIVLGVHDLQIEGEHWTYKALYDFVKSKGGVMILAHPYRYGQQVHPDIFLYPPDAIEILSSNVGAHQLHMRKALAQKLKVPMLMNSDSHHTSTVGCYCNIVPESCRTEASILNWIKTEAINNHITL